MPGIVIDAVTVCVGYADFLWHAARWNAQHFRQWVIVTSPKDNETRDVCRRLRLHCLVSEDHEREGKFSKGRMIERGLQKLGSDCWVLHMDADIVLPLTLHRQLQLAHLDPTCIHGCDRFNVVGLQQWQCVLESGWLHGDAWHPSAVLPPNGLSIGTRWIGHDGYAPIGFFQLWHRSGGEEERHGWREKPHPMFHGSACRTDQQFAHWWDRRKRVLLPELIVAHLESDANAPLGANWEGRKTARFGGGAQRRGMPAGAS